MAGAAALAWATPTLAQPLGSAGSSELNAAAALGVIAVVLVAGVFLQATKRRL